MYSNYFGGMLAFHRSWRKCSLPHVFVTCIGARSACDGSTHDGHVRDGSLRDGSVRDGSVRDGSVRDRSGFVWVGLGWVALLALCRLTKEVCQDRHGLTKAVRRVRCLTSLFSNTHEKRPGSSTWLFVIQWGWLLWATVLFLSHDVRRAFGPTEHRIQLPTVEQIYIIL